MHLRILKSITEISAEDWDKLNGTQNPFLSYSFFYSLEESDSLGTRTGWFTHFIVIEDNSEIIAGTCLYLKNNSYGEYIFDWDWADAYTRSGLEYYPKLISALPFTPITTPKLLVSPKADIAVKDFLLSEIIKISQSYSSFHSLFIPADECQYYQNQGLQIRHTLQYHWENKGYKDFNEFLAALKQKKRQKIRRERKAIQQEDIEFKSYRGDELQAEHAELMYGFYLSTVDKKNAYDYLSAEFFQMIVEKMPQSIVFFTAEKDCKVIAGALCFLSNDKLYGRYWGSQQDIQYLHFELCYYQAIEYAIKHGLDYEAGAQGEHKIPRGFSPTRIYSAHSINHPDFKKAINDAILRENEYIAEVLGEGGNWAYK